MTLLELRAADPLAHVNLLQLAPVRRARWSEQVDRVVVERPAAPPVWRAPLTWLAHFGSARRMRLDPVSSYAWRRLDGGRTVAELAVELRMEFGDIVEPAEERLGHLVRLLRREELVGYPGIDEEVSLDLARTAGP